MATCLECLDNLTDEDILRKLAICDANGNVAWRIKEVAYTEDCLECATYLTPSELLRKSLWCDDDGVFWLQVVKYTE